MGLNLKGDLFSQLKEHMDHDVQLQYYGDKDDPANVAIECKTCACVLLDTDAPVPIVPVERHYRFVCPKCEEEHFVPSDHPSLHEEWICKLCGRPISLDLSNKVVHHG